jgi:nicotinate phosphoribosyltransferase
VLKVLGIALTDTFGSPNFFEAFKLSVPDYTTPAPGPNIISPLSAFTTVESDIGSPGNTESPVAAPVSTMRHDTEPKRKRTYAEVYTGIRQDSGDPSHFVQFARDFYDSQGIKEKKVVVFSDSLNVDTCLEYKEIAETAGFQPTFGVGTFFTSKPISMCFANGV